MKMTKMRKMMMRAALATVVAAASLLSFGLFDTASATPSTHIWSPSTDAQPYGVMHVTADMYIPTKQDAQNGTRPSTVTNLGLTTGVLPYEKLNLEVGFDHIAGYDKLDNYPFYYNAKLAVPEGAYGPAFPALAAGFYMVGTKSADATNTNGGTNYNILYAKGAKTFGALGRLSAGYYTGNKRLLVDENGAAAEKGVLLCWERTMSEVSENLSVIVDYMGGKSSMGALSYGIGWKFNPTTSAVVAYVNQNNDRIAGVTDWFTFQVDIDFDLFSGKK